ncbi:MAG: ROK family protein, partial [Myxococcota bacterium]
MSISVEQRKQRVQPPLDPSFLPPALAYQELWEQDRAQSRRLVIAMEREHGLVSRFETSWPDTVLEARHGRLLDRLVKFLLWSRGGRRLLVSGPDEAAERVVSAYRKGAARSFDAEIMSRIYERPFEAVVVAEEEIPEERSGGGELGGHLQGCRIGFDLGASDYKLAAVKDGEAVFSTEIPWDPVPQDDPDYHYQRISEGLKMAAEKLPRVDAIGGS